MIAPAPPGGTRLVLIRHGEPDEAMRGRCYGSLDVGLSARGLAQARAVAAALADVPLDAVYSSPRLRARATAEPLGRPVHVERDLAEIDFGALEGMTYEEAERRYPEVYRTWMERPTACAFPGGESYPDVRTRVRAAAARIRAEHAGGCAAIVAHGGSVRTLLAEALRMADADLFRLAVDHASISVIDTFPDGTPLVRLVNRV